MDGDEARPGRVLISYAHEDDAHRNQVLRFFEFLRRHGVDAVIDREGDDRPRYWPDWMNGQLDSVAHVLVIGSPEYRAAAENRLPPGVRKGVVAETGRLKDAWYEDPQAARERILPVLLPGRTVADLPNWMLPLGGTTYRITEFTVDGAEGLLRVLTGQPSYVAPPLGPVPALPPLPPGSPAPGPAPVFDVPALSGQEVTRPTLLAELVDKLTATDAGTVAMTTALRGAGGFGKTTLARMLVHEAAIRSRFNGGILWLTLGEDVSGPELATRINDLVEVVTGTKPSLTDPGQAGRRLLAALGGRRTLLVVDDVWYRTQLRPFDDPARSTVVLVTTRQQDVLPDHAARIDVDAMRDQEARQLLLAGLPTEHSPPPSDLVTALLSTTGRWPVLLALVNGVARADVRRGARPADALREALVALHELGPTALDVDDPDERSSAVTATLRLSLDRLADDDRGRYLDLAVFGEDADIPLSVLTLLWAHSGGLTAVQVRRLCTQLDDLSLLAEYHLDDPPRLRLHDVIRTYLRAQVGNGLFALDRAVADAHRAAVSVTDSGGSAWWELPPSERYLWEWLPAHLYGAGLRPELGSTVLHPEWLVGKLERIGPAGLETDLALLDDPAAAALRQAVRQNAHQLVPLDPPGALAATLLSRLPTDSELDAVRADLTSILPPGSVRPIAAMPDLPRPTLYRTLTGHAGRVRALATPAERGGWVASAGDDGTVRLWDPQSGRTTRTFTEPGPVRFLAAAPDGTWLASLSSDAAVRLWDPEGGPGRSLTTAGTATWRVAVAPDGRWLATAADDGSMHVLDPATGREVHVVKVGPEPEPVHLSVGPAGDWLAGWTRGGAIRIWHPLTGVEQHAAMLGQRVIQVVIAADLGWLAVRRDNGMLRIIDLSGAWLPSQAEGHVVELCTPRSGGWLAARTREGAVQVWDPTHNEEARSLVGPYGAAAMVAAPDGSWLATRDRNQSVLVWDPRSGRLTHRLDPPLRHESWLIVAPDGEWLAARDATGTVQIWDPRTGAERHRLEGHTARVTALVHGGSGSGSDAAPLPTWWATGSVDGTVRIWDPRGGGSEPEQRGDPMRRVVAPLDGRWFATLSEDDVVRLRDGTTGTERAQLVASRSKRVQITGPGGPVRELLVPSTGNWLGIRSPSTGPYDHHDTVHLLEPSDASLLSSIQVDGYSRLTLAPDGSWLAATAMKRSSDGLTLWNTPAGTIRPRTVRTDSLTASIEAVAPGGRWLATQGHFGSELEVWEVTSGRLLLPGLPVGPHRSAPHLSSLDEARAVSDEILALLLSTGVLQLVTIPGAPARHDVRIVEIEGVRTIASPAFAPAGGWVAAVREGEPAGRSKSADRGDAERVDLWDLADGRHRGRLPHLAHHSTEATVVELAPACGDSRLVVRDDRGTITVWDTATRTHRHTLTGTATGMAVDPDGVHLATTVEDVIGVWDLTTGRPTAALRVATEVAEPQWVGSRFLTARGRLGLYVLTVTG